MTPGASRFEAWLETTGRRVGLVVGPLAFVVVLCLPVSGLTPAGHKLLAILALTLAWWVSEAVPLAATALLAPVLCVVLGVVDAKTAFAPFASPTTFLLLGMFLVGVAMTKHRLDRRVALSVLCLPGASRSPTAIFATLAILAALLSMWMSNVAAAAVMIPIGLGALAVNPGWGSDPQHRGALVLLIAFASSVGGLATPVGTPPNLIGIELLQKLAGQRVSFFEWVKLALPMTIALVIFLVWRMRPRGVVTGEPAAVRAEFQRQHRALGPWARGELFTAAALGSAIVLWIYPGLVEAITGDHRWGAAWLEAHFSEEIVGLLAGIVLFTLPTNWRAGEFALGWPDALKIDWGTLLLFGGGVTLGRQIFDTGLADAFGRGVTGILGHPGLWTVVAVGIVLSIFLSDFTSNTAAANVMVPMMLAVAKAANVDPIPVGVAACLACSFGNLLPVSTGTNALAYGTGHIRVGAMIRHGLALDIAGAVLIWIVLRVMLRGAG